MSRIPAVCVVLFCASLFSAPARAQVICESFNNVYRECRVGSFGQIVLTRELSENTCVEAVTWGRASDGVVWVKRNCRAMFEIVKRDPAKPVLKTLVCESKDGKPQHCEAETTFGVALVQQLTEEVCTLDRNWGFDEKSVWVSGNCRAKFALGGFRIPRSAVPASAETLRCGSKDGSLYYCSVLAIKGVGLVEQRSDAPCVLNRTWGYDERRIWVSDGCHAEFVVAR